MNLEAIPWERVEDHQGLTRHLSQGKVTVTPNSDGEGWFWWVDTSYARAHGTESGQSRAKGRAMLVYLSLTREVVT